MVIIITICITFLSCVFYNSFQSTQSLFNNKYRSVSQIINKIVISLNLIKCISIKFLPIKVSGILKLEQTLMLYLRDTQYVNFYNGTACLTLSAQSSGIYILH